MAEVRTHVTDGSPCWCDPVREDYRMPSFSSLVEEVGVIVSSRRIALAILERLRELGVQLPSEEPGPGQEPAKDQSH